MRTGKIVKIHSDFYYVQAENTTFECKLRHVLKKQKQKVFVGDIVKFDLYETDKGYLAKNVKRIKVNLKNQENKKMASK